MNLSLHNTKLRWIMIVVRFEDIMRQPNLSFFTETGQLINGKDLHLNTNGYVVLGTIQIEEHFEKMNSLNLRRLFHLTTGKFYTIQVSDHILTVSNPKMILPILILF